VSYDIYFVRRDPGQSFADALDATEESYDGDPGPLAPAELEQWERIAARAGELLDQVEEFGTANSRELSDAATGIQLSMIADEMTITVPSDRSDHDAVTLMEKVYALARVVEDETGLEGYDPQLQEPVTDPHQRISASPPPHGGRPPFDEAWNDARAVPASGGEQKDVAPPPSASRRRWWEFWKR
jgi:hypothetical protein